MHLTSQKADLMVISSHNSFRDDVGELASTRNDLVGCQEHLCYSCHHLRPSDAAWAVEKWNAAVTECQAQVPFFRKISRNENGSRAATKHGRSRSTRRLKGL